LKFLVLLELLLKELELFVQRMRRTEKKEEVEKCSFEHTSRTTPRGVAGMTEMTRVPNLSHCAAKGQRARALASP